MASLETITRTQAIILAAVIFVAAVAGSFIIFTLMQPAKPEEEITITIWTSLFEAAQSSLEERAQEYMDENPDIMIKCDRMDELKDILKLNLPAGVGPDLTVFAHDWIGTFEALNVLVPLDDYITTEFKDKFPASAWEAATYKGHIYGIPESAECPLLIYNKDMITDPPNNTDELATLMTQFYKPAEHEYGLTWPIDPYHVSAYIHAHGGFYFDDDTGEVGLNRPEHVDGLQFIIDNIRPYMSDEKDYMTQITLFISEKAPMLITGPWALPDVQAAGIDFGLVPIPGISGLGPAKPFMGVKTWMLTNNSLNRNNSDACIDFVKWFVSPPAVAKYSVDSGYAPLHDDAYGDPLLAENTTKLAILDQAKDGIPMPKGPEVGLIWEWGAPYWDVLDVVWAGGDVEAALDQAQADVLEAIEEMGGGG